MAELKRVGEVIESSTTEFIAQCYELNRVPPLGSLVKTESDNTGIYGILYYAATTSLDPGRRPIARGKDEAKEEDIFKSNPQLEKLLRSEFKALVVGHKEGESLRHYLPPRPAHIHGFVYVCPPAETAEFSRSFDFLDIILSAHLPVSMEEFAAAALRQMALAYEDRQAFLIAAGKELAVRLSGQFGQLKAILGRLKQ